MLLSIAVENELKESFELDPVVTIPMSDGANVAYSLAAVIYYGSSHFIARILNPLDSSVVEYNGMARNNTFQQIQSDKLLHSTIEDLDKKQRRADLLLYRRFI